jgi:serine/threonine-protein kinase
MPGADPHFLLSTPRLPGPLAPAVDAETPDPGLTVDEPADGGPPPPFAAPDYEILGELGRGGMGVVYKARQKSLNRVVALKVVLAGAGVEEAGRLRTEAEAIARLQHPNVVAVHEVGSQQGLPFFCLEFCPQGSLAARLAASGPPPAAEAARLAAALARGLAAAHRAGVLHRDLKPANVLPPTARRRSATSGLPSSSTRRAARAPGRWSARRATWRRSRPPASAARWAPPVTSTRWARFSTSA